MATKPSTDGKTTYRMYGGKVEMVFNPKSPKYRYTVTDSVAGLKNEPVRGVTTLLKDVIAKPDLMTWPMNMSHGALFGSKFSEKDLEYLHDWKNALIKPGVAHTEEQLHDIMLEGARAYTKRADTGKDVGTQVHHMVEMYLKKHQTEFEKPEEMPDNEMKMAYKAFGSFKNWWDSLKNKDVLYTELPVYSRRMKYAGTMDLVVIINRKTYLLDIKTSNVSRKAPLGIYAENFLQLAAYSYAFREEHGMLMDDLGIIRVGKDGRLNIVTAQDLGLSVDQCERAFAFATRLHDWLEQSTKFLSDARMISHLTPTPLVDTESASNTKEVQSV